MEWLPLSDFKELVPPGFTLRALLKSESSQFAANMAQWYPQFSVGSEKRFFEAAFYNDHIFGATEAENFLPILYIDQVTNAVAGWMVVEMNNDSLAVTSPLAGISPDYRGRRSGLGSLGPRLLMEIAKRIGADLVYYYSTLASIANQKIAEEAGYSIVGIVPAFDRDFIRPGVIKRSPEAIYAKVFADSNHIENPSSDKMTEATKALWDHLFGRSSPQE